MSRAGITARIDGLSATLIDLAQKIWERPEASFQEEYASTLHKNEAQAHGFKIIPTDIKNAVVAEVGQGQPIIGILGEYDALPGLSQQLLPWKAPVEGQSYGHGCGHNLLGAGSLGAALAVAEEIKAGTIAGTIRYYGCPAEERFFGKQLMAAQGLFDDLDACFVWHPNNRNSIRLHAGLAIEKARFRFYGLPAHSSSSPHLGRNALSAIELMNIGVHFWREKLSATGRIAHIITNGGESPNVIPEFAEVEYDVRGKDTAEVKSILSALVNIAAGAELMTQTRMEWESLGGVDSILCNKVLSRHVHRVMKEVYSPAYGARDIEQGKALNAASGYESEDVFHMDVIDWGVDTGMIFGSNDVGAPSRKVPLASFFAATTPAGVKSHSWQATAAHGSPIGFKGMIFAAKVLALAMYDVFSDPNMLRQAWEEFKSAARP